MTSKHKLIFLALMIAAAAVIAAPPLIRGRRRAPAAAGRCTDFLVPSPDKKPGFLFFFKEGCPICGQMRDGLKPVRESYAGDFWFTECDLKTTSFTQEEIDRLGVDGGAPHSVLLDPGGHVFRIYRGYDGQRMIDQIKADMDYILGRRTTLKPAPKTEDQAREAQPLTPNP